MGIKVEALNLFYIYIYTIVVYQILALVHIPNFTFLTPKFTPLRIQSIKHIQNIIKFVNVLTIGKRNKYIFIIGENKFI